MTAADVDKLDAQFYHLYWITLLVLLAVVAGAEIWISYSRRNWAKEEAELFKDWMKETDQC